MKTRRRNRIHRKKGTKSRRKNCKKSYKNKCCMKGGIGMKGGMKGG